MTTFACSIGWNWKGQKNKVEGPSLCASLDGCCFVAAINSAAAMDECTACQDCQNNTHPCGSCCSDMPAAPVFDGEECNADIEQNLAWCACAVKDDNMVFDTLVRMLPAIGAFVCLGGISKVMFDIINRRMFRKQRERAAVFAAAQVELGFMLRDQQDDALL
mmetsp:Transcript_9752/g.14064  ORF Transcript_9752/g.14064 Transcript_9752/m.14064 type:complete len:162 (+) Transcript_9752:307-792(+)